MWCSANVIVSIITIIIIIIIISVTLGAKETYCVLSCMVTIWLSVSKVRLACVICVRHVLPSSAICSLYVVSCEAGISRLV